MRGTSNRCPRLPAQLERQFAGRYGGQNLARAITLVREWYGLPLCALLGLASAVVFISGAEPLRPVFDDGYITLTFARNLAEHAKLSFDGETWSTGATSLLHVSLLAFLSS